MWRLLLVTLSLLVVASACEQTTFNSSWDYSDYEIEALIAH